MREKLGLLGGVVSAVILVAFAVNLMVNDVAQNVASWVMWTILDGILLFSAIAAGNKRPWLPAGYTLGASLVTAILLRQGVWQWGIVETLSALGVMASLLVWWRAGPRGAIVAATVAMSVAGIPTIADAFTAPEPASWWLWAGVVVACLMSLAGAKKWTIEEIFLPVGSLLFNGTMTILVLR